MNFLSRLIKNRTPESLSKEAYWKKYKFFELLKDLHLAEELLAGFTGGYSENFLSAENFHKALEDEIDRIEFGNEIDLSRLYLWFAPSSVWDDFTGESGQDLGNRIFERLAHWHQSQNESA